MGSNPPELLKLPAFIQSRDQVLSLVKEVLSVEDFLYKGRVRESGSKMSLPKTTEDLDAFAEANGRNVLQHNQRMELASFLRKVYKDAPEVYVQVGPASKDLVEGITNWFRTNIHAQTLLRVTENPNVGSGCFLRIKHKTYDLTLKHRLNSADASKFSVSKTPESYSRRANYL